MKRGGAVAWASDQECSPRAGRIKLASSAESGDAQDGQAGASTVDADRQVPASGRWHAKDGGAYRKNLTKCRCRPYALAGHDHAMPVPVSCSPQNFRVPSVVWRSSAGVDHEPRELFRSPRRRSAVVEEVANKARCRRLGLHPRQGSETRISSDERLVVDLRGGAGSNRLVWRSSGVCEHRATDTTHHAE
jgi:hypothetical protein